MKHNEMDVSLNHTVEEDNTSDRSNDSFDDETTNVCGETDYEPVVQSDADDL